MSIATTHIKISKMPLFEELHCISESMASTGNYLKTIFQSLKKNKQR